MRIEPKQDYILIKRLKQKDTSETGVLLVTKDNENEVAEVLEIGKHINDVKIGDKILFKNYAIDVVELDGEELSFIKLDSVIAVIHD